MKIMAN